MADVIDQSRQLLATGNVHAAAQLLREAANDPRTSPETKGQIGQLIVGEQIYEAFATAEACLSEYLRQPRAMAAVNSLFGHVLWVNGKSREAVEAYRRAIADRPDDPGLLNSLGMVLLSAEAHLDAYLAYSTAILLNPDGGSKVGRTCAYKLLKGDRAVKVRFAGEEFTFELSGKTVEVDFAHVQGQLAEPRELDALAQLRGQVETIVDIGSNVGNHACFFAKALRPRRLIAFEVNPRCIPVLRRNLELNTPPGCAIDIRAVAVGREKGTLILPFHDDLNTGLVADATADGEKVAVEPLDSLVDSVQLLKIDVEGMELDVLHGASKVIARCRPVLFIEVHRQNMAQFEALMKQWNYVILITYPYHAHTNVIAAARENQENG